MKGKLTTIFVVMVLATMAYMSMWLFYADIVFEYSDVLDFTVDKDFNETFVLMNETLGIASNDMTVTHQDYLATGTGSESTASDKMIVKSFGVVKDFMVNSLKLIPKMISDTATKLKVPGFWVTGFITIILIVIIITIVAGFLKATNW